MSEFKLTILGSGSALPRQDAFHTSQVLDIRGKQFLIDCGEGAQIRMRQYSVHVGRLNHIFISHLHGDHCFGLIGLISTMGMLGRTADIVIHSHPDLEALLAPLVNYFCSDFPFKVEFQSFTPYCSEVIYEDRSVKITTLPLKHRVPSSGFLFEEKPTGRHLLRDIVESYNVPVSQYKNIKAGANFVTPEGEVVLNEIMTAPPSQAKRFAYMSDTAYSEKNLNLIEGVDCLYHEATFLSADAARIKATLHSSAQQAALIAKKANVKQLIIGHYSARYKNVAPFLREAQIIFQNTYAARDGEQYVF